MSIEEQARRFGVPMPETCKQLAFNGQTNFVWVMLSGNWFIAMRIPPHFEHQKNGTYVERKNEIVVFESVPNIRDLEDVSVWVSAPQLHEFDDCDCGYMLWLYGDFDAEIVARHKIKNK